ncbi:AAA family ATPase (plasmid) [Streptomyces clavuligerus]|nr:BTAD domain-containing putative transcriptional regulator [Streptomyces clavuligerus]MBY6306987.1 AAA family ATPase [Streptomyces clavuligerus]QPL67050.1 AAA family ATPase [Streptomyces clavuligerus]QPL73080.1 AAA family ATPase [Streptomyces clavuligerus]QPL79153.1 AAA family ATPase [Streptomyces clavuligerus]QPL85184.1 AAA family ATPase [Streptomyces clavuligerus]
MSDVFASEKSSPGVRTRAATSPPRSVISAVGAVSHAEKIGYAVYECSDEVRHDVPGLPGPSPSITVLGCLGVRADGRKLELGPPRQRAVFALLLINAGSVVPVDSIVFRIWGNSPPGAVTATLQSYVSRLRKLLAECVLPDGSTPELLHQPPGYTLALGTEHIDANRFEQAIRTGRRLSREEQHQEARAVLCQALLSWGGTPYEELSAYDFAVQEANRLEQLRLGAVETWAHCCLRLGRDEEVMDQLKPEVQRNPLRERLIGQLMQAQYRLGCQADALRTYEATRRALAEELGTDPGKELAALHAAILRQDNGLDRVVPASAPPSAGVGRGAVTVSVPAQRSRPLTRPVAGRARVPGAMTVAAGAGAAPASASGSVSASVSGSGSGSGSAPASVPTFFPGSVSGSASVAASVAAPVSGHVSGPGSAFGSVALHRPQTLRGEPVHGGAQGMRTGQVFPTLPPFVGRGDELRGLLESATSAFHTSGRVAFVVGEAGSGKTRLLSELERSVPDSVRTVWASCSESEDRPDYWPWTTVLRHLYAMWPERMHGFPGWLRRALAELLPEVGPEPQGPHSPDGGEENSGNGDGAGDGDSTPAHTLTLAPALAPPRSREARFTLHDAVCQALLRTVREPVVIMLEDMERADAPSLALLRLLVEQLRTVPLLLVVTTRTFRLAHDAELRRAAAVILQSTGARRVLLNALDARATGELAGGMLGKAPDTLLVRALHERSAGNPYFLVQLLRSLRQGLAAAWETEIPDELAGVVLQRLSSVPPAVRRVLDICAVVERSCERRVIETVLRHEGIPLENVRTAVRGGLLEEDPDDPGRLRFVHPLVREAVWDDLENTRRPVSRSSALGALATV